MIKLFSILAGSFLVTIATAEEIAVTVYNSNLGVVSEIRSLEFEKGIGEILAYMRQTLQLKSPVP